MVMGQVTSDKVDRDVVVHCRTRCPVIQSVQSSLLLCHLPESVCSAILRVICPSSRGYCVCHEADEVR